VCRCKKHVSSVWKIHSNWNIPESHNSTNEAPLSMVTSKCYRFGH